MVWKAWVWGQISVTGLLVSEQCISAGTGLIHPKPLLHVPHGELQPFHLKSTCITQSTQEPDAVHIWSRTAPKFRGNETRVLHRVEHSDARSGIFTLLLLWVRPTQVFQRVSAPCDCQVMFWGLGFRVKGLGVRVHGLGFQV